MANKVLMAIAVLLAMSMLISQGGASITPPGSFQPIVSTDWLEANLGRQNLVVLDVRSEELYEAGHIPEVINVPEGMWYANPPFGVDFPWMELPPDEDLFELIGNAGITKHSLVVVVGATSGEMPWPLYDMAGATRVAITLLYAGVRNVAILDGGHDKWVADGYSTESGTVTPTPVTYKGKADKTMFVSMAYVKEKIGKSIIVDARDPEVYSCMISEPWTAYDGHIPTARNLPAPWLWNIETDYITYKDIGTLKEMASDVVGKAKGREIIVYCGVGGYASTVYFVLSEVLGYNNVRIYDGSAQEWTFFGQPVECPPP